MCGVELHVHLGGDSLLGIAHPVVGPPFKYKECTGRRHSDEVVIMKEADVWPLYYLCKKCFL